MEFKLHYILLHFLSELNIVALSNFGFVLQFVFGTRCVAWFVGPG